MRASSTTWIRARYAAKRPVSRARLVTSSALSSTPLTLPPSYQSHAMTAAFATSTASTSAASAVRRRRTLAGRTASALLLGVAAALTTATVCRPPGPPPCWRPAERYMSGKAGGELLHEPVREGVGHHQDLAVHAVVRRFRLADVPREQPVPQEVERDDDAREQERRDSPRGRVAAAVAVCVSEHGHGEQRGQDERDAELERIEVCKGGRRPHVVSLRAGHGRHRR